MEIGASLSYLGMQIEGTVGAFVIGMDYYLEPLVLEWPNALYRSGPGTKDTFKIDVGSPLLKERERKLSHSTVVRVLYLVKRERTDALAVTTFLCTRVTKATKEDQCKLERLLGYFKSSKGKKLHVRISAKDMQYAHSLMLRLHCISIPSPIPVR